MSCRRILSGHSAAARVALRRIARRWRPTRRRRRRSAPGRTRRWRRPAAAGRRSEPRWRHARRRRRPKARRRPARRTGRRRRTEAWRTTSRRRRTEAWRTTRRWRRAGVAALLRRRIAALLAGPRFSGLRPGHRALHFREQAANACSRPDAGRRDLWKSKFSQWPRFTNSAMLNKFRTGRDCSADAAATVPAPRHEHLLLVVDA